FGQVQHRTDSGDLRDGRRDKLLSAEARVYGHYQDEVDVVEHRIDRRGRRPRIKSDPRSGAKPSDLGKIAIQMPADLDVNGQPVRATVDEGAQVAAGVDDHQVHIERQARRSAYRGDDDGPEGNVRHELSVHDVDVDAVDAAGAFDFLDLASQ